MGDQSVARSKYVHNLRMILPVLFLAIAPAVQAEEIKIVATVNDEAITTSDVAARRALMMAGAGAPMTPENEARITPQIVESLINERLQIQEAKRQSISISDAEIAKAIDVIGARQNLPPGELPKMLASKGLSVRSLEEQTRAELAWVKVVQRKLRRNVTVTQDELRRAAQAEALAPGVAEMQIAALVVPITPKSKEKDVKARVNSLAKALASGKSMNEAAAPFAEKKEVLFSPPMWVAETKLPPALLKELSSRKDGEIAGPMKLGNSVQFLQILGRRTMKKQNSATELTLKQLTLDLPAKPDKAMQEKLTRSVATLRADAGSCEDVTIPATPVPVKVEFTRSTLAKLVPSVGEAMARIEVGAVSEPIIDGTTLTLMLLCERREPVAAAGVDPALEQQLIGEKLTLEAEKHLRDLRREATIDVRGAQ